MLKTSLLLNIQFEVDRFFAILQGISENYPFS